MNWHEVTDFVPSKIIVNMVHWVMHKTNVCVSDLECCIMHVLNSIDTSTNGLVPRTSSPSILLMINFRGRKNEREGVCLHYYRGIAKREK